MTLAVRANCGPAREEALGRDRRVTPPRSAPHG